MPALIKYLPASLKALLLTRFLRRHGVCYASLPAVGEHWPSLHNAGELHLGAGCQLRTYRLPQRLSVRQGASLHIGAGSFLNDGVTICACQSISIGEHAKIGDMSMIYDSDFHPLSPGSATRQAPVVIGRNVWIGAQCMVLAGASIGDNSVIAAGSVVTGKIPANSLAAGAPARVIKQLDIPPGWLRP